MKRKKKKPTYTHNNSTQTARAKIQEKQTLCIASIAVTYKNKTGEVQTQ